MFTAAERNSLLLTVTFLLLGAGAKAWVRAKAELGPFDSPPPASAVRADDSTGSVDTTAGGGTPIASTVIPADSPVDSTASSTLGTAVESAAPRRKASTSRKKSAPAGKVDLNRDGADELAAVPGIGPKTALAIIDYRKSKGGFRDLRELLEVKGIGERKLERIAPFVAVPPGAVSP